MTSLRKPIAVGLPITPSPAPVTPFTPRPTRIPNPATMLLARRLREIEHEYTHALDVRSWHETLAHRSELLCERLSAERHDIEQAIKAIAAREASDG